MIVAQISDTHLALDTKDAEQRLRDFAAVVDDIAALDPAPDAIVHTGDIVQNGRAAEYAVARDLLRGAGAPVYLMAGNKDDRAALRAAFPAAGYLGAGGGFVDYAVEGRGLRLVMTDTLDPGRNKGAFCATRARRLAELIGAGPPGPVAVFAHHPPIEVTVGPERTHFGSAEAAGLLARTVAASGRVVGLFCGHVHRPFDGAIGETPVRIMTACATMLRKGIYPAEMQGRPVYALHRYDAAAGRFRSETRIAGVQSAMTGTAFR